jgi:hypothetical protein
VVEVRGIMFSPNFEVSHPVVFVQYKTIVHINLVRTQLYYQKWYMQYLQYQLHVSASTSAIIRLAFKGAFTRVPQVDQHD